MSNTNLLFDINQNSEFIKSKLKDFTKFVSEADAIPYLSPLSNNKGYIDVVSNFKWTKTTTAWVDHKRIPTIQLTEYYITHPAFISNMSRIYNIIASGLTQSVKKTVELIKETGMMEQATSDTITKFIDEITANREQTSTRKPILSEIKNFVTPVGVDTGNISYLKAYENLYGVGPSDFKYKFPYFTDTFKNVNNTWGQDTFTDKLTNTGAGNFIKDAAAMLGSGFGIDFAKIYNYNSTGPTATVSFFLDNTFDSSLDYSGNTSFQKNWELVFLLLYQNLPARINSLFLHPPVLYRAKVQGVLSFLYSYISNLTIDCLGNKQHKDVYVNFSNQSGSSGIRTVTTLIPEAYKVTFTLQSLLPETKNLFLNSFDDKISTTIESPNNTTEVIKNRSSVFPDGL